MFAVIIPLRPSHFSEYITYEISEQETNAENGDLVEIAMGNKRDKGIIYEITEEKPEFTTKIMGRILAKNILPLSLLSLYTDIAQYFFFSPSFCITKGTPKHIINSNFIAPTHTIFIVSQNYKKKVISEKISGKKQLQLITLLEESAYTKKELQKYKITNATIKGLLEKNIIEERKSEIFHFQKIQKNTSITTQKKQKFSKKIFLGSLYSAKTTKEIEWITQIIEQKKQVCIIFPDKILLEQTYKKYKTVFPDITILYNGRGKKEETSQYWKIKTGNATLIFGLQSSLLLPFHSLGGIIIFEYTHFSHCSFFSPYLKTPELAEIVAKKYNIPLLLSSSSGDISQIFNTEENNITSFSPTFEKEITIADTSLEFQNGNYTPLSGISFEKMKQSLEKKEKIVLFFNRKGLHKSIVCTQCGDIPISPFSGMRMPVFQDKNNTVLLRCGQSGYTEPLPEKCKKCNGILKTIGEGTQNIELFIQKQFPESTILRVDGDSFSSRTKTKNLSEEIINADIIIGTQIIFSLGPIENCSLAIDLFFENNLSFPSLIAEERTWIHSHLLSELLGKTPKQNIIIQTFQPNLPLLDHIKNKKFVDFYTQEITARKLLTYPPFSEYIIISKTGKNQQILENNISNIIPLIKTLNGKYFPAQFSILPHQQKIKAEIQCFFPLKTEYSEIKKLGFQLRRFGEWG